MALQLFLVGGVVVLLAHLMNERVPNWAYLFLPIAFLVPFECPLECNCMFGQSPSDIANIVSALFTVLGVILAFVAYVDWQAAEFTKRQMDLYFELIDTTNEFFREVREGTEESVRTVRDVFDAVTINQSHLLDRATIRAMGVAERAAEELMNRKKAGIATEEDGLKFYCAAMELRETLQMKTAPFRVRLKIWMRSRFERSIRELITTPVERKNKPNAGQADR